jgi:hypothetical protein
MSFEERDGQVILTMSRYDYLFLKRLLYKELAEESRGEAESTKQFLNRLNSGNPNYTPYQTGKKP